MLSRRGPWSVSYGAPALIILVAALGRLFGAAFALPGCALREISGDATITIPGGAGTPYVTVSKRPRARLTGFYHQGRSLLSSLAPALRFAPSHRPKPLSGPTPRNLPIIPGDEGGQRAADPPHWGGAMPNFREFHKGEVRILGILGSSPPEIAT
jgi:hypothetical protein